MELNKIRKSFLEYFKKNDHAIYESSSLIPKDDPTLYFVNAGMVQFKEWFLDSQCAKDTSIATSQKCIRAGGKHNDLENVGYTKRHHTFFEMLGNFAFNGVYFKERAIELAWNYLTKELLIDAAKLYITVFHEDDEAFTIWKKITGFSNNKIIRISSNDNFWSMGETGPCGPCTEIFFDHGNAYQGGLPGTKDADGDRYTEIWNIVFMQYNKLQDGRNISLNKTAIDTGMGIERIAAVLQGVADNYEISDFKFLINQIKNLCGAKGGHASYKVIADHMRAICHLIADGVMPGNEGRGYILRRIIRRALRHSNAIRKESGYDVIKPILYKFADNVLGQFQDVYLEIKNASALIKETLKLEEEKFNGILDKGIKILKEHEVNLFAGDTLSGDVAFMLYDTYGFPLDLTKDILRSKNILVDEEGFEKEMQKQKVHAKNARPNFIYEGSGDQLWKNLSQKSVISTEFVGYDKEQCNAKVLAITSVDGFEIESAKEGESVCIIFDKTPFYAESGGQVSDTGVIEGIGAIYDVQKKLDFFVHFANLNANIEREQIVKLQIDSERRFQITINHSATHLLHMSLRLHLGDHVTQKGSIVDQNRLRFDFSHHSALKLNEIESIENTVNDNIFAGEASVIQNCSKAEAMQKGAMALFGESYKDNVRVVSIGKSIELCGGTHVKNTASIGAFKIINQSAVAAGIRRIEAVTGKKCISFLSMQYSTIQVISELLKCNQENLVDKIINLQNTNRELEKKALSQKLLLISSKVVVSEILGRSVASVTSTELSIKEARDLTSIIQKNHNCHICLVYAVDKDKLSIIVSSGIDEFAASALTDNIKSVLNADGGGNKKISQIGGITSDKLDKARRLVIEFIKQVLGDNN